MVRRPQSPRRGHGDLAAFAEPRLQPLHSFAGHRDVDRVVATFILDVLAILNRADLVGASNHVFSKQETSSQIAIRSGRAHDDREAGAVDAHFHRLLDRDAVALGGRLALAQDGDFTDARWTAACWRVRHSGDSTLRLAQGRRLLTKSEAAIDPPISAAMIASDHVIGNGLSHDIFSPMKTRTPASPKRNSVNLTTAAASTK